MKPVSLFISYRRADLLAKGMIGRIYDELAEEFGEGAVFYDEDAIPPGSDFRTVLDQRLEAANYCLVLIGPHWEALFNERRNDQDDFVRLEIEAALHRKLIIIPVLLAGTMLPSKDSLPLSVQPLLNYQTIYLDCARDFRVHMERLIEAILSSTTIHRVALFNDVGSYSTKSSVEAFLNRLIKADCSTREFLWFEVIDLPMKVRTSLLLRFLSNLDGAEPSWRVRRAIGHILRTIVPKAIRTALLLQFLESPCWMMRCVGLVGARDSLDTGAISRVVKNISSDSNSRVDEVWLANLYLCDYGINVFEEAYPTLLMRSAWGIIDLWRRVSLNISSEQAFNKFEKKTDTKDKLSLLSLHILLDRFVSQKSAAERKLCDVAGQCLLPQHNDLYNRLRNSELVRAFYKVPMRSRLNERGSLHLQSQLVGHWRDDIRLDLAPFLKNWPQSRLTTEITMFRDVPFAEVRMGIARSLYEGETGSEGMEAIREGCKWAIYDEHPWVRREALPLYSLKIASEGITNDLDRELFPGVMDLFLVAARSGVRIPASLITKHCGTISDKNALASAIKSEQHRI